MPVAYTKQTRMETDLFVACTGSALVGWFFEAVGLNSPLPASIRVDIFGRTPDATCA